jgi:mono/diheme cytochrome c family protein
MATLGTRCVNAMKTVAAAGFTSILFAPVGSDAAAATPSAVAEPGESDYVRYCAPCHGSRGNGDGALAALLTPRPARHSDAAFMRALSDDYLIRLLKEGGPAVGKSALMGAWGRVLSDQQIVDLVTFMRLLSRHTERKGRDAKSG